MAEVIKRSKVLTVRRCAFSVPWAANQPGSVGVVLEKNRQREMPVVDTWWQTETGGFMITPLPALPS